MPGRIPRKPSGDSAAAEFAKWQYDQAVKETQISQVSGQRISQTTAGKIIITGSGRRRGSGASVATFKIRFVEDDYIIGREWDGTAIDSTDVYIAKPEELKCSSEAEDIYGEEVTYTYAPDSSEPYMEFGSAVPGEDYNEWGEFPEDYDVGGALYQLRLNVVRTAVRDGVTEFHRVIKPFGKGQIIQAIEFDGGNSVVGYVGEAGQSIDYLALMASRNWARI